MIPAGTLALKTRDFEWITPTSSLPVVIVMIAERNRRPPRIYVPFDGLEYIGPPYQYEEGELVHLLGHPDAQMTFSHIGPPPRLDHLEDSWMLDDWLFSAEGQSIGRIDMVLPVNPRYPLDGMGSPVQQLPRPSRRSYVTEVDKECGERNNFHKESNCFEDPVTLHCLSKKEDGVVKLPSGYCVNRTTVSSLRDRRDPLNRDPLDQQWRDAWGFLENLQARVDHIEEAVAYMESRLM